MRVLPRFLAALLLAGVLGGAAKTALADPPAIEPLRDHVGRLGSDDKYERRFILNRCTALYIFASSTVDSTQPLHALYTARAVLFLGAARAAADQNEVLMMLLTRMSTAYRRSSDADTAGVDPLAHPFFQSELAFCEDYAAGLG